MSEYCFIEWKKEIAERGKKYQWGIKFLVFTIAYPFLLGLIFSRVLADKTLGDVLIKYLREQWCKSISNAAAIVNFWEFVTEFLKVFVSQISEGYIGRFQAVLWLSGSYSLGLLLLWVFEANNSDNVKLYIALLFISLGKAGDDSLKSFIKDQLKVKEPCGEVDEERLDRRADIWCGFPWLLAATIAVLLQPSWEYPTLLRVTFSILIVELFGFWLGKPLCAYEFSDTDSESAWKKIYYVGKAAIKKRHLPYPNEARDFYKNLDGHNPLCPDKKFIRWLDRASMVEHSTNLSVQEQVDLKKLFTVAEVEEVKRILSILPRSPTLVLYSIAKAAGPTLFIYQASEIDSDFPVIVLIIIQTITSNCASLLWSNSHEKLLDLKILIGTICSNLCIICSLLVEIYRKHACEQDHVAISIWWLTPQFIFLGLAEGLLKDGIEGLFKGRVSESMGISGTNLVQVIIGIGRLLSFGFVVKGSAIDETNGFRLGYFGCVGASSGVNAFIFGPILYKYYKDDPLPEPIPPPDDPPITKPIPPPDDPPITKPGPPPDDPPITKLSHPPVSDPEPPKGTPIVQRPNITKKISSCTENVRSCGCRTSCDGFYKGGTNCCRTPIPDWNCIPYSEGTSYIFPPFACGTDFHNPPPVIVIDDSRPETWENSWENFHTRAL